MFVSIDDWAVGYWARTPGFVRIESVNFPLMQLSATSVNSPLLCLTVSIHKSDG